MSLYKRNDSPYWWMKITTGTKPFQRSTGTTVRADAQKLHDKASSEAWGRRSGVLEVRTWSEAKERFLAEKAGLSSTKDMARHLKFWDKHFRGIQLQQVTRHAIAEVDLPFTDTTANRYRSTLRSLLNMARDDWDWLNTAPTIKLKREPTRRVRWITRTEANRLIDAAPDYLQGAIEFSLQTGLRQSNVLGLRWSRVDMLRQTMWVYGDEAKGKVDIAVPLNSVALQTLLFRQGLDEEYVFTNRSGKPLRAIDSKMWARVLRDAKIKDFRWHDLRHTWASWHVQQGTSLQELMELGGWKSLDMVLKYAHLSSNHLQAAAQRIESVTLPEQTGHDPVDSSYSSSYESRTSSAPAVSA
jgi:integrase